MTTNPDPIPIRLISTCIKLKVNLDMPKIIFIPFQKPFWRLLARKSVAIITNRPGDDFRERRL